MRSGQLTHESPGNATAEPAFDQIAERRIALVRSSPERSQCSVNPYGVHNREGSQPVESEQPQHCRPQHGIGFIGGI